jgi:hypothetical protein
VKDSYRLDRYQLKVLIVSLIALVAYTAIDISSGPIWMKNGVYDQAAYDAYFVVWQVALAGYLLLVAYFYRTLWVPLAVFAMTLNGTEDFLYYVLQGQGLPPTLPWLNGALLVFPKPATSSSVVLGAVWGAVLLYYAALHYHPKRNVLKA